MAHIGKKKKKITYMHACFIVVKGSYNKCTVIYVLVPAMNIVGLVQTTIALVL